MDANLFNFFELFGDSGGGEETDELLTSDDQLMFSQFLDNFASNPTGTSDGQNDWTTLLLGPGPGPGSGSSGSSRLSSRFPNPNHSPNHNSNLKRNSSLTSLTIPSDSADLYVSSSLPKRQQQNNLYQQLLHPQPIYPQQQQQHMHQQHQQHSISEGKSVVLPTPSPPAQTLHSTATTTSSFSSTPTLSTSASLAQIPAQPSKKRGRKPKDASDSTFTTTCIPKSKTKQDLSSSTTTATTTTTTKQHKSALTVAEKKANHIQAEQRRRQQIRDALKELSTVVPGLRPPIEGDCSVEGSSRVEILEGTKMYVEQLRERIDLLKRRLHE
ncbi:UNVERIFIED_CONTAM: hypothetical protein HDU68_009251 [Siphonaria sp. JEL0065]|nr:hypothetical protein HDU68_009251 [Siphonaria sp. JEL0065]